MKLIIWRVTRTTSIVAFLVTLATACDPAGAGSASLDSPYTDADTLFLDPARVVGLVDGESEYLFGSIVSVASDSDGRIYVGDRLGATVRVLDRNGEFLAWIAREGEGQGEISAWPAHLHFGPDDRLYVRDGARVTVFGKRVGGLVADSVVAVWNTPGSSDLSSSRSALTKDGRYLYPGGFTPQNELPRYFLASYTEGELDGDTLDVPRYPGLRSIRSAIVRIGADGLMLRGLNRVPFSPIPIWAATPEGTMLSYDGVSSHLLETDVAGDTVRTIQLPAHPPRPVPAGERTDSLAALEQRIAEAEERMARFHVRLSDAVGLGEGVQERRLPDSLPTVIGLSVTQDGSIWLERWPPEDGHDARYYDVLDPNGRLRYVAVLRAPLLRDPSPWFGQGSIAGIIRDPEIDVERVVRFDLP